MQLRRARQALNFSEKDIADRLRITVHYVKSLETDRFEKLPGTVFARGYIKSYADAVDIEPAPLLAIYDARQKAERASREGEETETRRHRDRNRPYVFVSAGLFVAVFVGLWLVSTIGEDSQSGVADTRAEAESRADEATEAGPQARIESGNRAALQPATITPADSQAAMDVTSPADSSDSSGPVQAVADNGSAAAETLSSEASAETVATMESEEEPVAETAPPEQAIAVTASTTPEASAATAAMTEIDVARTGAGDRLIEVHSNGSDVLRIMFSGESWVEVNNGSEQRIYRDLREAGDVLEIIGEGPFNILLGDAPLTQLEFNGDEVDVSDDIRVDNSARLTVGL